MAIQDTQQFLNEVDQAIAQARKELQKRQAGIPSVAEASQLEPILKTLETLAQQARSGTVPPKPERNRVVGGMIYMVVDGWDFHHPLSLRLADIWNYYLERL